jgi:Fe-Mn family superoxide dismutase
MQQPYPLSMKQMVPTLAPKAHRIVPLLLEPKALRGLSERLLASHYENNYGGAVRRLNAIEAALAALDPTAPGYTINGLKREQLVAYNSMLLHELYFESLGGMGGEPPDALAAALAASFGSVARWRSEFVAMGRALAGGSGWVLLCEDARERRLVNQWAADHTHALAGARPLLALDMYEHAYHLDYGANAAAYVDAYMANLDWVKAAARWRGAAAPHDVGDAIAPEELRDALVRAAPLLLDVRRAPAFAAGPDAIVGAQWRAPETVADWARELPADRDIVVYCVYGHNVSRDVTDALLAAGRRARPLLGGIAAWHAIGGPVAAKPPTG